MSHLQNAEHKSWLVWSAAIEERIRQTNKWASSDKRRWLRFNFQPNGSAGSRRCIKCISHRMQWIEAGSIQHSDLRTEGILPRNSLICIDNRHYSNYRPVRRSSCVFVRERVDAFEASGLQYTARLVFSPPEKIASLSFRKSAASPSRIM
jgi:hypothetical protein